MTTNHIDQLAEWYAQAESGPVNVGDTVIYRHAGQWIVDVSTVPYDNPDNRDIRILARAPKPKPAWHDAPAVTATYRDDCGMVSGVWTPSGNHGYWIGPEDDVVTHDSLEDVTPLIEAKVTDEARERVWKFIQKYTGEDDRHRPDYDAEIDGYITAALGLETE